MQRLAIRTFATQSGQAAPKRQSTFMRVWVSPKEAWPIFAMCAGATCFVVYKFTHDFQGPEYHFDKKSRATIDYLENDKDPKQVAEWGQKGFRKGPDFIQEKLIWKQDEVLKKSIEKKA